MADVTLVLRADNSDYIRKMKEAQQSSQKVYDTVERGSKKQKGLMEDIEDSINKYQTALKKATNIQDIEKYNRKIAEAKQHLNEYETAGVRANENIQKSSNKLMDSLTNLTKKYGLVSIAIAAITKIGRDLVQTFKDTTGGLNLMTAAGELWKQTIYNIITANQEWYQSSARSLMIGKMLNEQRKEDRKDLIETSKLREEYNQLYYESANRTKTNTERLEKMDEAMKIHNQLIDIELKNAYHQLVITEEQLVNRPKSNKLLNQEAELIARLNEIEGKRWSETKRLEGQRTALQKEIHDEMMQRYFDEIEANNKLQDEKLKAQEEFKNLAIKLIDEYDKAEIESLEGEEKLAAQRDYQLKAVILFREQMKQEDICWRGKRRREKDENEKMRIEGDSRSNRHSRHNRESKHRGEKKGSRK